MAGADQRTASARAERLPAGVLVLALRVFVVGTGEFVLAGLIPLPATDFGLSVGAAGQVVTAFALTCALSAPVATTLTVRWPPPPSSTA